MGGDSPIPFVGVYLTLSEYSADALTADKAELAERLKDRLMQFDRKSLLRSLGHLWEIWNRHEEREKLINSYVTSLDAADASLLTARLASGPDRRVFLAKQLIVQAMTETLRVTQVSNAIEVQGVKQVIEICHLVAEQFGHADSSGETIVIGTSTADELALSMASNMYFNATEDDLARMVRAWRMWNTDIARVKTELRGNTPAQVFSEVMSYSIEVHFALMMSVYVRICPGGMQKCVINSPQSIENFIDAFNVFMSELTADMQDNLSCLSPAESEWDIGVLHSKPLIQIDEDEYVVTDHDMVMNRLTSGLIQNISSKAKSDASLHKDGLMNAWGHVIENYVTDALANICYFNELKFWTEEEIAALFPGQGLKRPDFVLLDGNRLLVVEVMKSGFTGIVQKSQDIERYRSELNMGVLKKCDQLSQALNYILSDQARLGISTTISIVVPLIVSGSGLSSSRVLQAEIERHCQINELFKDRRIRQPVCLDVGEVEMLEGLVENGASPASILLHWFSSDFSSSSLKNYLVTLHREDPMTLRPTSLSKSFEQMVRTILNLIEPK